MIFLGRYSKLKIQKYATLAKNIIKNNDKYENNTFAKHNGKRLVIYKKSNRSVKV